MTNDDQKFEDRVKQIVSDYLKGNAFIDRKLTDNPNDNLQVVPRKYVNMYSSVAGLPISSVIGQQVFATDLGYPVFKHQNGRWVNGVGSIIS